MKSRISSVAFLFVAILLLSLTYTSAKGNWKEVKPFVGDRITTLLLHPSGKIFAGTISNGLYVSSDDGDHWSQCYNYRTKTIIIEIRSICIDTHGNVYVGTTGGKGIVKSTDEGNTWTACDFPDNLIDIFSVASDNDGNVFAGTASGIYISSNEGGTWSKILNSPSIVRTISVKNNLIYAGVDYNGLYISKDHGNTWTLSRLPSSSYWSILPINQNEIFVAMNHPLLGFGQGIYVTKDGGKSWTKSSTGLTTSNINALALAGDSSILAAGSSGRIFKSENDGESWSELTSGKTTRSIKHMILSGTRLLAASDGGGIMISDDEGASWTFSNSGFSNVRNRCMLKLSDGTLLISNNAGLYNYNPETEIYRSITEVIANQKSGSDAPEGDIDKMIKIGEDSLLIGTYQCDFWLSGNSGNSWKRVNKNYSSNMLSLLSGHDNYIFYGALGDDSGLYRTSDYGKTWDKLRWDFQYCKTIAYDKSNTLYAGNYYFLYSSNDNGNNWNYIRSFDNNINDIFISSRNEIFVSTEFNGVFHSTDAGGTWSHTVLRDSSSKLASTVICYKVVETSDGQLFLSTSIGLYESTDNGINWHQRDDILKNRDISGLSLSNDGSILAVADGNAYELNSSVTAVDNIYAPNNFELYQNYPNPFNPVTTINYSLPASGVITLKVYDIRGRVVAELVNENQPAGRHFVVLSADKYNLSSGVYFYRLTAGGYAASKKFVLLK